MGEQSWAALVEALSKAIGDRVGITVAAGATLLTGLLLVYYTPQILSDYTEYVLVGLLLLFVFIGSLAGWVHSGINDRRNRAAKTRRVLDMLESLSEGEKAILEYCVQQGASSIDMPPRLGAYAAILRERGILTLVPRITGSNTYIVAPDIWDAIQRHGLFKGEPFD